MLTEGWLALYRVLQAQGLPKPVVPCPTGAEQDADLGWPQAQVAIITSQAQDASRLGWKCYLLSQADASGVAAAAVLLDLVGRVRTAVQCGESLEMLRKPTSQAEERFMAALCAAGVPPPKRHLKIGEGPHARYPDYAWPEHRLIVELDGAWWHGGRDLSDQLKELAASDADSRRMIKDRQAPAAYRDATRIRQYALHGWHTMVVSEYEVNDDALLQQAVQDVVECLTGQRPAQGLHQRPHLRLLPGGKGAQGTPAIPRQRVGAPPLQVVGPAAG